MYAIYWAHGRESSISTLGRSFIEPIQSVNTLDSLSPRVKVGFIGVGSNAVDHVASVSELGHTVVAGCATSENTLRWRRFKKVAPEARFIPTVSSLIGAPDVNAIVACLPWNVTQTWLTELIATPKPLLLEKPAALSSSYLEKALAAPDATCHNKVVGFNRRFYKTVQRLKKRVDQGGVKTAEVVISETVKLFSKKFGPEIVPSIPVYSSCHILDVAMYILGDVQPVRTYTYQERGKLAPFKSLTSLMETSGGIPVSLIAVAENPLPVGIRVLFDDQTTWHLSPMERLIAFEGYRTIEPAKGYNVRKYIPEPFLEISENETFKPGFLEQMKTFLEGPQSNVAATLSDQLVLLRFIELIYSNTAGSKDTIQSGR